MAQNFIAGFLSFLLVDSLSQENIGDIKVGQDMKYAESCGPKLQGEVTSQIKKEENSDTRNEKELLQTFK